MTTTKIEIVKSGFSNVGSVLSAFSALESTNVSVISEASESKSPHLLILPGNGSFQAATLRLEESGIGDLALERHSKNLPLLGICLGMQLFGETSEESPGAVGLGIIPGSSSILPNVSSVPHVGWEEVLWSTGPDQPHFDEEDFYFMHSYEFVPTNESAVLGRSQVGRELICSSVMQGKTIGVQFHPEKSSRAGQRLLLGLQIWLNE